MIPDKGGRIVNYPECLLDTWPKINQHYENGVGKNTATGRGRVKAPETGVDHELRA